MAFRWALPCTLLCCAAATVSHHLASAARASWKLRKVAWEPLLGEFAFKVTTASADAQRLFGIGLLLLYNFDQPNARSAFEEALAADQHCAMCAWGLAHSVGPYFNVPIKPAEDIALGRAAARNASKLLAMREHSTKEAVFVKAMAVRYPESSEVGEQMESWRRYAAEFHRLRLAAPSAVREDPDLLVFDAEAMMLTLCDVHGIYHFYTLHGDEAPPVVRNETAEATIMVQVALNKTNQSHPYAHHLLIHSTEMSNAKAELIVSSARQLKKSMAALQDNHLQHMTSHTFFRTGRYHEAVEVNKVAVATEQEFLAHGVMPYGPGHDNTFLVEAAMFGGERATAYHYVQVLQRHFAEYPDRPDGPDGKQAWGLPLLVAVRFGDWDRVQALDVAPPGNFSALWPYGHGVMRAFGLGVAAARTGRLADAQGHLAELVHAARHVRPSNREPLLAMLANLTNIAESMLTAAISQASGDLRGAVQALGQAVDQEMALPYNEPPDWPLPTRECHGQALLQAGRAGEAESLFRRSLYGYSFHAEQRCGWALLGLRASLQAQSQTAERELEIRELTWKIKASWRHADAPLTAPCPLLGDLKTAVFV